MATIKAYSLYRPIGLGTYPKSCEDYEVVDIVNFGTRQWVETIKRNAWGYVVYEGDVDEIELHRYEMVTPEMCAEPALPPSNVIRKMAKLYLDCDWDKLDHLAKVAEGKGYDMEALDVAISIELDQMKERA